MFFGFNLGKLVNQRKLRKPFSQKTGLFDRELKDELKEEYHTNPNYFIKEVSTRTKTKSSRRSSYSGLSDPIIEIIIAILIVILVISILSKLEFLAGFF